MCGIAGSVGAGNEAVTQRMVTSLEHRGPDGVDYRTDGAYQIAYARLSINDPLSGSNLITDETGQISIAFNGEIYNHRQLRAQLEGKGHVFATRTDTEVVVHLYEEMGTECVRHLRGMFAFAILDGRCLFLARDRLGIKPLHYSFIPKKNLFVFASEIKAILQCSDFTPNLDMTALADSIILGHPAGTRTFVEGIKSLAAGHTMTVVSCSGEIRMGQQISYSSRCSARNNDVTLRDAQIELAEALEESVALHMTADVEVGLTLSGGLDSTVLALIASERRGAPLVTFTVADREEHPDMVQAKTVAQMIGAEHHPVVLNFDDYMAAIPSCVAAEEQPSTLYGLPYNLLCTRIANRVKACIHGEGADELFGGYREYLDRQHRISWIQHRLPLLKRFGVLPSVEAMEIIERLSSASRFDEYLHSIFEVNLGDALERHHLDVVDKGAMAVGLEMRVPYLDDRVFGLVNQLPLNFLVRTDIGVRKYILRRLCLERYGNALADVVFREKLGVPSAGIHYLSRFDRICSELLPPDYLGQHELGYCFSSKRELLMFEMFMDIFMKHRGDSKAIGGVLEYMSTRCDNRATNVRTRPNVGSLEAGGG